MMTYEEIYNALFGQKYLGVVVPYYVIQRAQKDLATMSNEEWCDWIDYKNDRLDQMRRRSA